MTAVATKGAKMTTTSKVATLHVDHAMLQAWGIINEYRKRVESESGMLGSTVGYATNFLHTQWFYENKQDLALVGRLASAYEKTEGKTSGKFHTIHISAKSATHQRTFFEAWKKNGDFSPRGRGVLLGYNQRKIIWVILSMTAKLLTERVPELANLPEFTDDDKRLG